MRRTYSSLVIVSAVLVLAGCGSDEEGDPIPAQNAAAIETQLNAIEGRIAAENPGACADIGKNDNSGTLSEIERQIAALPDGVDQDVVDALEASVDRLGELVRDECDALSEQTETTPEDTETITIETVPTETETVPSETTPEETETVPPGQEEQPEKPGKGPKDGGGTEPGGGGTGGGSPVPEEDE